MLDLQTGILKYQETLLVGRKKPEYKISSLVPLLKESFALYECAFEILRKGFGSKCSLSACHIESGVMNF